MGTPQRKGRKLTAGETRFVKPNEMTEGQTISGVLTRATEGDYGMTYYNRQEDGTTVGLNGSGQLDKLMEQVAENDSIEVTYQGQEKIKSGKFKGKAAHQFEVVVFDSEDELSSKSLEG